METQTERDIQINHIMTSTGCDRTAAELTYDQASQVLNLVCHAYEKSMLAFGLNELAVKNITTIALKELQALESKVGAAQ